MVHKGLDVSQSVKPKAHCLEEKVAYTRLVLPSSDPQCGLYVPLCEKLNPHTWRKWQTGLVLPSSNPHCGLYVSLCGKPDTHTWSMWYSGSPHRTGAAIWGATRSRVPCIRFLIMHNICRSPPLCLPTAYAGSFIDPVPSAAAVWAAGTRRPAAATYYVRSRQYM